MVSALEGDPPKRIVLAVRRDLRESGSAPPSDAESPKGGHVVTDRDHRKVIARRPAET
jgi:hypothetical protein